METIQPGRKTDPTDWWIGKTVHCQTCDFKGRLVASDKEKISMSIRGDRKQVEIYCPNCHVQSAVYGEGGTER